MQVIDVPCTAGFTDCECLLCVLICDHGRLIYMTHAHLVTKQARATYLVGCSFLLIELFLFMTDAAHILHLALALYERFITEP